MPEAIAAVQHQLQNGTTPVVRTNEGTMITIEGPTPESVSSRDARLLVQETAQPYLGTVSIRREMGQYRVNENGERVGDNEMETLSDGTKRFRPLYPGDRFRQDFILDGWNGPR